MTTREKEILKSQATGYKVIIEALGKNRYDMEAFVAGVKEAVDDEIKIINTVCDRWEE